MPQFEYFHTATKIEGIADKNKTRRSFKIMHAALVLLFAGLVLAIVSAPLGSALTSLGVILLVLGMITQGPGINFHTTFSADFSTGALNWHSTDDHFWEPVKKFLENRAALFAAGENP